MLKTVQRTVFFCCSPVDSAEDMHDDATFIVKLVLSSI